MEAKREKITAAKKAKKPGRPSKTKVLEEKIVKLEKERDAVKEQLLRLAAEFENYKKITSRNIENRVKTANEDLLLNLLPILDDLERSLEAGKKSRRFKTLYEGIELIYNNFKTLLEKYGVEPIESVGQPFNVDVHEALLMVENDEYPSNVVLQEHQKGYRLKGKVIRHAKVVVTK
ncbi:heat shock protein GrpE [bacterium BMS3Abin05]|nr:heat shock protein GrpE [bacterium BMS3Abin05]GBE28497.1 heat shock protein GrpE [bacterium BMS3Bbin03]HDL79043.1 nucleotide exchange factor GrpE [Bacteroidota bacterium]HDZ13053.1 nucleotide exchange factor GrpE [Bacteroidota bacterium]